MANSCGMTGQWCIFIGDIRVGHHADLLFGAPEILVAAHMLENGDGVRTVYGGTVEHHHIILRKHNILRSEGVLTESYFPGDASWGQLTELDKRDIENAFPEIGRNGPSAYGELCRMALKKKEARVFCQAVRPRVPKHRGPTGLLRPRTSLEPDMSFFPFRDSWFDSPPKIPMHH